VRFRDVSQLVAGHVGLVERDHGRNSGADALRATISRDPPTGSDIPRRMSEASILMMAMKASFNNFGWRSSAVASNPSNSPADRGRRRAMIIAGNSSDTNDVARTTSNPAATTLRPSDLAVLRRM